MNYRIIATERRISPSGTPFDYIVWIGEFEADTDEGEAMEFAREAAPGFRHSIDSYQLVFH